jgi:murein tripeptide amidase MpaA
MAEWWVEGFLARLLDPEDAVARELLEQAVVYLVPNMCIDGGVRGHLRTNAHGRNLNREWAEPCPEKSPEVYYTRQKMHETGVDFAFDVHGDEGCRTTSSPAPRARLRGMKRSSASSMISSDCWPGSRRISRPSTATRSMRRAVPT